MGRKKEDFTLTLSDGSELIVRVTQLPAETAPGALARAGRIFGEAIMMVLENEAAAQQALCRAFTDEDFTRLRAMFLATSERVMPPDPENGRATELVMKLRLESFDGELRAQMDWMLHCVSLNFMDFFLVARATSRRTPSKKESGSSSPNGSTGPSGESSPPAGSP